MSARGEFRRRLTTVLSADVVGYTRLTEADETGTHHALREALTLISDLVTTHRGVVAHCAGDAILAEFAAVLDGLNCAVEIQQVIAQNSTSGKDSPFIRFRIGLNVGDVIDDGEEIFGDTVNTAVRLQSIAEPGGVCFSEAVRNAIGRQLPIAYEFVGEERLKNLSIPVRAYRALLDTNETETLSPTSSHKPTVVVMPFENLGGTEEDAASLTDDMIRELSRFRGLEVMAHNSTVAHKRTPIKAQQPTQELEVEYLVEGHVRSVPERIRVSVQLVSACSGHHIWSEVYERAAEQTFSARDEITRLAVAAIAGRVHVVSGESAKRRPREKLQAFEHILRGQTLVGKGPQGNAHARSHYHRALALEPQNARALADISLSYVDDWWNGNENSVDETLDVALNVAQQAYGADIGDSKVHWVLGLVHCLRRELRQATRLIKRANQLNPNDADGYAASGLLSLYRDDLDRGAAALATASMLNPFPSAWYRWLQGLGQLFLGEPMTARLSLLEALQQNPHLHVARISLVITYVELGDLNTARKQTNDLRNHYPGLTRDALAERIPTSSERQEQIRCALKAAGFERTSRALLEDYYFA